MFLCQVTIGKGQFKGKQFYFGFFDIFGESIRGAFCIEMDFRAEVIVRKVVEPIEDAVFDFADDIFNFYMGALTTEISLPSEIPEGKQRSCISPGKPLYRAQVG